ncbi:MAG: hsp70 family protein [Lentisphaeria bacterium]|nr:hsp70 family protein [Lentisphaeria bacterium]
MEQDSRYIIGIDLGTTNCAVQYIDTQHGEGVNKFDILQVTAPGETDTRDQLPSFLYLPGKHDLTEENRRLPWEYENSQIVGIFARDYGSDRPNQFVNSAKSWLAHNGVDRDAAILPWGISDEYTHISPLEATTQYLLHIRKAWNQAMGKHKDQSGSYCILETQQVTITIPASFDETARELTIQALRKAGYKNFVLLEEPLAAFYCWLNFNENWQEQLTTGDRILVIDVGGGTTDFSYINIKERNELQRFSVGEHLLLGGDNIDMTIAKQVESSWGIQLDPSEWCSLIQKCRAAKEELLENPQLERVYVQLQTKGSSIIANTRSAEVSKEKLNHILEDGFYPITDLSYEQDIASGIRTMGLPYAQNPAISDHLLNFLRFSAKQAEVKEELLAPTHILLNGGSLQSSYIQKRILEILSSWFPQEAPVKVLDNIDLSQAVAIGASYYGRVRRGEGVKVSGGILKSYYVKYRSEDLLERLLCVQERNTPEHKKMLVPEIFHVNTNQAVTFELWSSATRLHDQVGQTFEITDDFSIVAPIHTVLKFGKMDQKEIPVQLSSERNAIGSMELFLNSQQSQHNWPLSFDLRSSAENISISQVQSSFDEQQIEQAKKLILAAFKDIAGKKLPQLLKELESLLEVQRNDWPASLIRTLLDSLLEYEKERLNSAKHEARWLNLSGFFLRPGFGFVGDEVRIQKLWKLWFNGPMHKKNQQVQAEWWIFWRRIAGGLKAGHQGQIAATLIKKLIKKGKVQLKQAEGDQARREMWRCLGAMEYISAQQKQQLLRAMINWPKALTACEFWVAGRIWSRNLIYGNENNLLPADQLTPYIDYMLSLKVSEQNINIYRFMLQSLINKQLERPFALSNDTVQKIKPHLEGSSQSSKDQSQHLDDLALGDQLPIGLVLKN